MTEKQYSIIWTACGTWLAFFCVDSFWVSRQQESFAPGIGALDSDPYSAALWGVIVGSTGVVFLCILGRRYAESYSIKNELHSYFPAVFGLEERNNRSQIISKWAYVLFVIMPLVFISAMFPRLFTSLIYANREERLFEGSWLESRISALKNECNAYADACFRLGGKDGDEYFPIATDLIPIALFLLALTLLYRWRRSIASIRA